MSLLLIYMYLLVWESFFFKDLFFNDHDIGIKVKKKIGCKNGYKKGPCRSELAK